MSQLVRSLLAAAGLAAAANAFAVADPRGDFLPSFTGRHVGALDIVSADIAFDAVDDTFLLHAATAVAMRISGDGIFATVPAALLPANGVADADAAWSLWSVGAGVAGLARNADFASACA